MAEYSINYHNMIVIGRRMDNLMRINGDMSFFSCI